MTTRAGIVTGTALALLMAAGHAWASPQTDDAPPATTSLPLLLAQADEEAQTEEERREPAPEQAPPAEEAPAVQEPPAAEEAPVPEPAPVTREAPAAEEPPAAEQPPAAQEAPAQEQPAQDAPAEDAPTAAEPVPGEQPAPTPPPVQQPAPTPPPAQQPAPTPPPAQPSPTPPPGSAEPIPGERPTDPSRPPQEQPAPTPPPAQQPAPTPPPAQPAPTPPPGSAEPIPGERPTDPSRPPQEQPAPSAPPTDGAAEPVRDAPILDSQKEAEDAAPADPTQQPLPPAEPAAPPPASDAEAQQLEEPVEIESLRAEEGRRIDRREERRERREGSDVLREIGDRLLIQLGNSVIVQSDDRQRLGHDATEVYYEELPRGRTRETVVRPNGVQIVTVYDRWGDIVRRSRIMPDGREHVLVWAGDRDRDERRQWRDPGLDLPPLRLGIPPEEYTLDARRVRDERAYYDFLNQPPVEPVRRLYSVDEVRYSARVRDSVRRIELDTITFDFGSASISEEAIPLLAGVAHAIDQLLDENPAEVFLIEGHTDAVGSEEANLALSDRRAEAVATALTNVFSIPPENMVTQGYGKRYLKVNTQEPERQNRRVVMRRITPLVAPVASSQ